MTPYASIPQKGSIHAVGWDIRADLSRMAESKYSKGLKNTGFKEFLSDFSLTIKPQEVKVLPTGLKVELDTDMEMDIKPRSGLFSREGILAQGTIDPDYRGEIGIMMINLGKREVEIRHGERLAQAVIRKVYNQDDLFLEVNEENDLSFTQRGDGGFGSTGIK
jgi:dUTP pyrophosphatase